MRTARDVAALRRAEHEAYDSVPMIQRAVGVLMVRYGISSDRAAGLLVAWAQEAGCTVVVTAHALVLGVCGGDQLVGAARPKLLRWLVGQMRVELPQAPTVPCDE